MFDDECIVRPADAVMCSLDSLWFRSPQLGWLRYERSVNWHGSRKRLPCLVLQKKDPEVKRL